MADYKDMITGTLGKLAKKAKELATSESVANARQKLDQATEGSMLRNVYEQGASRAKLYARIAKLGLDINGESEELKRVYAEIGKLYYDQAKDAPEGFFAPLFQQAENLLQGLEAKEQEIEALKAEIQEQKAQAGIDVEITEDLDSDIADFEQIVDATENDGDPGNKPE